MQAQPAGEQARLLELLVDMEKLAAGLGAAAVHVLDTGDAVLANLQRAASTAARISSSPGMGMRRSTNPIALSRNRPVGSFVDGSRKITPPLGSGVWALMPANFIAC